VNPFPSPTLRHPKPPHLRYLFCLVFFCSCLSKYRLVRRSLATASLHLLRNLKLKAMMMITVHLLCDTEQQQQQKQQQQQLLAKLPSMYMSIGIIARPVERRATKEEIKRKEPKTKTQQKKKKKKK
jgi:hypothetical protein